MREPPGPCGAGRLRAVCGPDRSPAAARPALVGRAAVCAGGRRPAREIATREPAARSGRSRGPPWPCRHPPAPRPGPAGLAAASYRLGLVVCVLPGQAPQTSRRPPIGRGACVLPGQAPPPPTGTAFWPSGPSGALHTSGAGSLMIGSARRLVVWPGPAAAHRHRGLALLWSLRHYANPSNDKRPGPQPHKQTLNNVHTRPVVQCLPMRRCAYPRLGLLVWAVHPIRRHCTRSERVQRHVRGAALRNGCRATCVVESLTVVGFVAQRCYAT